MNIGHHGPPRQAFRVAVAAGDAPGTRHYRTASPCNALLIRMHPLGAGQLFCALFGGWIGGPRPPCYYTGVTLVDRHALGRLQRGGAAGLVVTRQSRAPSACGSSIAGRPDVAPDARWAPLRGIPAHVSTDSRGILRISRAGTPGGRAIVARCEGWPGTRGAHLGDPSGRPAGVAGSEADRRAAAPFALGPVAASRAEARRTPPRPVAQSPCTAQGEPFR